MEKIVVFNCDKALQIKQIASALKIKTVIQNNCSKDAVIENLINEKSVSEENCTSKSLLLMCDLTDKHVDRILARLKEKNILLDYKAVLTATNRKWTLGKMMAQMEFEKQQYINGR